MPDDALVEGDESLRYPIREVLENAINHHDIPDRNCKIDIRIDRTNDIFLLTISDNGPGIPKQELQTLQSQTETQLVHTSGVGLWLVIWLSQLHGGSVEFDAENGTTVLFSFQAAT